MPSEPLASPYADSVVITVLEVCNTILDVLQDAHNLYPRLAKRMWTLRGVLAASMTVRCRLCDSTSALLWGWSVRLPSVCKRCLTSVTAA
jgi:hypothetical protein